MSASATSLIRIGTRASPLALRQAEIVEQLLTQQHAQLNVEIVPITTEGDRRLDVAVSKFGGKGVFLKELQLALLAGDVDLCVHSMKDVPVLPVDGLEISATLARDDARDAFISDQFTSLEAMPQGAIVGTSSTRRKALLLERYPYLDIQNLRGNIHTRLKKLKSKQYDAIILAVAGLERMGMLNEMRQAIDPDEFTPAVTQGIVGIETRQGDERVKGLLAKLHSEESWRCAEAERAVSEGLGGDCHLPLAAWARSTGEKLMLDAGVFECDGQNSIRVKLAGAIDDARGLGLQAAHQLLEKGAEPILQRAREAAASD